MFAIPRQRAGIVLVPNLYLYLIIIKELTFPWFGPSRCALVRPTRRLRKSCFVRYRDNVFSRSISYVTYHTT
jgi:hypothetical protein